MKSDSLILLRPPLFDKMAASFGVVACTGFFLLSMFHLNRLNRQIVDHTLELTVFMCFAGYIFQRGWSYLRSVRVTETGIQANWPQPNFGEKIVFVWTAVLSTALPVLAQIGAVIVCASSGYRWTTLIFIILILEYSLRSARSFVRSWRMSYPDLIEIFDGPKGSAVLRMRSADGHERQWRFRFRSWAEDFKMSLLKALPSAERDTAED